MGAIIRKLLEPKGFDIEEGESLPEEVGIDCCEGPPVPIPASIVGACELNFCVRDGNRWNLSVIATGNGSYFIASPFSSCFHFTYLRLKEKGRS